MMKNFFGTEFDERRIVVGENDILSLGRHKLVFMAAPMVHWPEVILTYDCTDKVLFSADAFGKFGTLDVEEDWAEEARRYYIGIVGKYGVQVQNLLNKTAKYDIQMICPLHGPILSENINYYLDLYNKWSGYQWEEDGVFIAYTSIYGNTQKAVVELAEKLKERGCHNIIVRDIARCDMTEAVAKAFQYSKLVLATTTYNAEIFPAMREFIHHLTGRNYSNRIVAFIENGSWAPLAAKVMREMLEKCKGLIFTNVKVTINSAFAEADMKQVEALANEIWPIETEKIV